MSDLSDLSISDKPAMSSVLCARELFELVPERRWCFEDPSHEMCVQLKGARWPEPFTDDDLDRPSVWADS